MILRYTSGIIPRVTIRRIVGAVFEIPLEKFPEDFLESFRMDSEQNSETTSGRIPGETSRRNFYGFPEIDYGGTSGGTSE